MRVFYRLLAAVIITGSISAHAQSKSKAPGGVQAEALPVTRTDGDLKLTFTKLEVVPPPPGPPTDDPDEASWTRVNFLYDWKGRAMKEWSTHRITVLDAAGQTYNPKRTSTYFGKESGSVSFSGPVWPTSQPWKVRIELARTSPIQSYDFWNRYNPEEILTVKALPVPVPGGVVASGQTAEAHGAKVQLLGFAAGNTRLPDALPVQYPYPTLHWRVERPKDVHVTFLRATDAAGRVITTKGAASGVTPTGERYARELEVPSGVREVYVAFGVHRSRFFELTAIPQQ